MIYINVDTAVTVPVNVAPLIDDTDFKTRETAIAYNQAGMDLVWNFVTSAGVVTQTAVTPTTSGDYDWTHVGDGMYKIEIPASGGASINNDAEGVGYFTGICTGVLPWRSPDIVFRAAALNDALIDGGDNLDVNAVQISGDSTAADNLEAACDGTGYNIGNGSVVAASVTGSVGGNVVGSVASVTAGVTVTTNNDKSSYSLTADQSGVTIGTVNALGTSAVNSVNAEVDTALADIHLDHLLAADYDPASKPGTSTALLNELIESDSGVSRFTANALEQAPSGGGTVDANITQIEGHALAGTGTQIADAFEHFFNVATPSKTINDCGVAGSGLSAEDVWTYGTRVLTANTNLNDPTAAAIRAEIDSNSTQLAAIVADTNEMQGDLADGGRLDLIFDAILVDTGTTLPASISSVETALNLNTSTVNGINTNVTTIDGIVDAIKLVTDNLPNSGALTDLATSAALATVDTNVDAILVDTGTTIPATLATAQADLDIITGSDGATLATAQANYAPATASALATVDTNVDTLISELTTDVSEPGVPGATATVPEMLATLYGALRNRIDVTSSAKTFYNDAGSSVWSKSLSDDGTTYTEAEGS